jgi:lysophospholipase L1-like esterase
MGILDTPGYSRAQADARYPTKQQSAARGTLGGRIVYLGDSITKGAATNTSILLGESYPLYASILSGQQLYMAANSGIGGQRTDEILARMDTDVWAYSPQTVIITAGTNDYLQSVPFATFKTNFAALIDNVQSHNAGCVVATMPPHNTSSWHTTISLWNTWIKQYAASRGVFVLDFNALLTDPATGNYVAGLGGEDLIHPNSSGYQAMGQLAVTQLSPKIAPAYPPLAIKNNDANNLFANGLMITDTNADGIPDGWSASGGSGYTHSLVTVTNVPGKVWRTDMAAGSTTRSFNSVTVGTGKIAAGERILFMGRVGAVAGSSIKLWLQFLDSGGAGLTRLTPMDTLTRSISDGGVFLIDGVAPANVANAQIYGTIGASTAGGRIDLGQITILNLTRLGLA